MTAAARVSDALSQDVLLAPIEASVIPLPHQIRALSRRSPLASRPRRSSNGSPVPEFETDDDRTYFLIRLRVHERASVTQARAQVTPQATPQVTPQVQRLLEACNEELGREDLQEGVGIADRKHFRSEYLRPALEQGLVEMTIPDKPRSSKQRYRLTDEGRRWLSLHGGAR